MKKLLTSIIAILLTFNALALDVWDGSASSWTNGSGTESDPYLIETAANLAYLAQKVNEGYQASGQAVFEAVYFLMTDDLDLNNINWTPIGNVNMSMQGFYFAGVFDGWYHNIDKLKITSSSDVCGLFGGAGSKAVIQRLSVTNGSITSTGTGVGGVVGAVAGEARVYQCSFSGSISVSNSGSYCGAGGISAAAAGDSIIIECSFRGSITATNNGGFTGAAGAGGIVGIAMDNAQIDFCYNTGNITGSAFMLSVAAGIVGATLQDGNASVFSCYNVGTVNAGTKGGIFGMVSPISPKDETAIDVNNCYYLNTCGGTTNYGTSKTSAEMQTSEFMFTIDQLSHCFAMDNGTNNGYPVNGLVGIKMYEPSDITAHSAHLSAEVHPGNHSFTDVLFYCKDEVYDQHTVHVGNEGYVEATMEQLLDNTQYLYLLGVTFEDNSYEEFGTGYFITEVDGISEISNPNILIYPNPTSDFIFIENIEPQQVTIYSLDGKLVKSVENANIVDVRDLESGLYLININGVARKIQIK